MFGLLGKTLSHSFSKEIHESITNKPYSLYETNSLSDFFKETPFQGLNVTIPYKQDVIPFIDELTPIAKEIQTVNTIYKKDGLLIGHNTDYDGLDFTLKYNDISLKDKIVLILGNGSTSKTIKTLCTHKFAKKIIVAARHPNEDEVNLLDLSTLKNVEIIFNATPVGMFPDNDGMIGINLSEHLKCEAVIDVVYNPLRTRLLLEAEALNIKAVNGLMMLIHQAMKSIELFHNITLKEQQTIDYYKTLVQKLTNLVLIGMPMSGKSHYAKRLAATYDKDVIELDAEIEKLANKSIPLIFEEEGEPVFRQLESNIVELYYKHHNLAISSGGGVVKNPLNIRRLKQNGVLLFLDMPYDLLKNVNPKNRPLLVDQHALKNLYDERYLLYKQYSDVIISKDTYDESVILSRIEEGLYEYFNTQWAKS